MPASKKRSYARTTLAAVALLGKLVELERKTRRITLAELADRLGVDRGTLQRLEKGDPKIELGLAFEACVLLGIPLFEDDPSSLARRLEATSQRLALLPRYARPLKVSVSDDF